MSRTGKTNSRTVCFPLDDVETTSSESPTHSYFTSQEKHMLAKIIREVRGCKTAAEERSVVHRECATIRKVLTALDSHQGQLAAGAPVAEAMLKLVYVHMLGYPTEFGQMYVVKLLAANDLTAKRVGYLALPLLIDESHEVLTLAENHIKKDMVHPNPFVQCLALNVVANIAGTDMASDVLAEVTALLGSTNLTVRRKATLAALRIVQRFPRGIRSVADTLDHCFSERNHGMQLSQVALLTEILSTPEGKRDLLPKYVTMVPAMARNIKNLVMSTYTTDHDVGHIADPFLQIRWIRLLRVVGTDSAEASEAMNDVLAQVATNTNTQKNPGCAVILECARTICTIRSDESLRALAINVLANFLANNDNNQRFVALSTLLDLAHGVDRPNVLKQRNAIFECLKDPDLPIRRKAFELSVALIDQSNIRLLVPDLISYVQLSTDEVKAEATERLSAVIESIIPSPEWTIEMALRLLKVGKQHVPVSLSGLLCLIVAQLQEDAAIAKVVRALWEELSQGRDNSSTSAATLSRHAFLMTSIYLCGEFVELCVKAGPQSANANSAGGTSTEEAMAMTIASVNLDTTSNTVRLYALAALAKIGARYPITAPIAMSVFETAATSLDCELQQRAIEYLAILQHPDPGVAKACWERVPKPDLTSAADDAVLEEIPAGADQQHSSHRPHEGSSNGPAAAAAVPASAALDDLFGGLGDAAAAGSKATAKQQPQPTPTSGAASIDNLFAGIPSNSTTTAPGNPQRAAALAASLFDSIATPPPPGASSSPTAAPSTTFAPAFSNADVNVLFTASRSAASSSTTISRVTLRIANANRTAAISDVAVLVAVTKGAKLDLHTLPSSQILAGGSIDQQMTIETASSGVDHLTLTFRVKLVYRVATADERTVVFQVVKEW